MDSRILPELFAEAYERLWDRTYKDGGIDGGGGDGGGGNHPLNGNAGVVGMAEGKVKNAGWRVSSGEETLIGLKTGAQVSDMKRVGKTAATLKNERLFKYKVKVDKRLRRLAREISAMVDGRNVVAAANRVCTGRCKKYGDAEWDYCARCGGPMRQVEENE
jgi:hypothetical protein